MKKKLVHLTYTVAFCFLTLETAWGCTVAAAPSLTAFDTSEYIFIGEVVDVADAIRSTKFHGAAWGLKIKVKNSVNLPKSPVSHFVVFPFDLGADCKDTGRTRDELLTYFPVGSDVRVIAKESKYAAGQIADGNIGLEILPDNLGSIARNYSDKGKPMTSVSSIYNYKSYVVSSPCGLSKRDVPGYEANMLLLDFEFRKDLMRLRNAESEKEKVEILERLIYLPKINDEYIEILALHLKNENIKKELTLQRTDWSRAFLSKSEPSC